MKNIIKRPLVTEKNTYHQASGMYVFECITEASKLEIKIAVEKNFGAKVDSVNTINCRGKAKKNKFGHSRIVYWKKAIVKLKEGEKIALFEGV